MNRVSATILRLGLFALPAVLTLLIARPAGVQAGGGGCHQLPEAEGTGNVVTMTRGCFTPTVLRVEPGTAVVFENDHEVPHNVLGLMWGTTDIGPGFEFEQTFPSAGIFPYQCNIHPFMVGVVIVGDGGAPANTDVTLVRAAADTGADAAVAEAAEDASVADDGGVGSFPAWAFALAGVGGAALAVTAVTTYRRRSLRS
jgi:plastocyanin